MTAATALPAPLAAAVARERHRFGGHVGDIRFVASLPSTMDYAAGLAAAGAAHGTGVLAGQQTAGRGRRGHTWASPARAGLYLSLIVRPPVARHEDGVPSLLGLITLTAGLAAAEGIAHATGLEASLKWPNDLFCADKLGGVLAEGHHIAASGQCVVIGLGVNVHDVPYVGEGVRATSIARELGASPDTGAVLAEILAAWAARYQDLLDGRYDQIVDRWRSRASGLVGRLVRWSDETGERQGTTTGVDATGALLVDTGDRVIQIRSGAVQWS